jgi:hypothetical protein
MTDDEDQYDPESDPDFISSDGPREPTGSPWLAPAGLHGAPGPVFVPTKSLSLEEEGESDIPHAALWSMKYHRHVHLFDRTDGKIRQGFGTGDHAIYIIDDGRKDCLVSRLVGGAPDGCTYCLVAQITIASYERLVNEETPIDDVFAGARDIAMCAVFEAEVEDAPSNVTLTERYATIDDVPSEYLGPNCFIEFADDPASGAQEESFSRDRDPRTQRGTGRDPRR